jgi:hypothetical protein
VLGDSRRVPAWPALWGGEGAVLLGRVVAGGMHPNHLAVQRQLHRPADQGDLDAATRIATAGPIRRAGEADVAAAVDHPGHRLADGGGSGPTHGRLWPHAGLVVRSAALAVGSQQHAAVADLDQAVLADRLHQLAGEHPADVVAEPGQLILPAWSTQRVTPPGRAAMVAVAGWAVAAAAVGWAAAEIGRCSAAASWNRATGGTSPMP